MDLSEMLLILKIKLRSVSESFEPDALEAAVTLATLECGWQLPASTAFRVYWLMERAYRHCIAMMCSDTASKFKFKQINLQHRFDHWFKLLQSLDKQFDAIRASYPEEFPIESALSSEETIALFGDYQNVTMQRRYDEYVMQSIGR